MDLIVASYNVAGLGNVIKRKSVWHFLKSSPVHIVFLQETYAYSACETLREKEWGGDILRNYGTTRSKSVAIAFKSGLQYHVNDTKTDDQGRLLLVDINIENRNFCLGNVYGPNVDNPTFYSNLFNQLQNFSTSDITLGGDFNLVLNNDFEKLGCSPQYSNYKASNVVNTNMKTSGLTDIFRSLHPTKKLFTRVQNNPFAASRLEFFLISNSLLTDSQTASILPSVHSNHRLMQIKLSLKAIHKGTGYWKFNNSSLLDKNFASVIKNVIGEFQTNYPPNTCNPQLQWDTLKCVLRGYIIEFSAKRKKMFLHRQNLLRVHLQQLQDALNSCNSQDPNSLFADIKSCQYELDSAIKEKAKGAAIRSRAKWVEPGKKNTKYFFNLEKSQRGNKSINKIKNTKGILVTEQQAILEVLTQYFKSFYSSTDNNVDSIQPRNYLSDIDLPILSKDQTLNISASISEQECHAALNAMSNNKSPGPDGFTAEFYKMFWDDLKPFFFFWNVFAFLTRRGNCQTRKWKVLL